MKRGIKRLFHANKVRVITYLLVVIFFASIKQFLSI